MESRESSRSYVKRDTEEEDDLEGSDKKRHRSSKSRRHGNSDEGDERDSGSKRKSSAGGDRSDSRRKSSGGSSHPGSGDDDDYESRQESRSRVVKKNPDERSDRRSGDGYREREMERGNNITGHEGSQSRSRSKVERLPYEDEPEKSRERDRESKHFERKESGGGREKDQMGSREQERSSRRRWDETDMGRKPEDINNADRLDSRSERISDSKTRARDLRNEFDRKSRGGGLFSDKGVRTNDGEEKRVDEERSKSRGRSEAMEDDNEVVAIASEVGTENIRDDKTRMVGEKSGGLTGDTETGGDRVSSWVHTEYNEKDRRERREMSVNLDEDGQPQSKDDRHAKEVRRGKRSWSPEKKGRHRHENDGLDRGGAESDNERSVSMKVKDREKEPYRDDRLDSGWNERNTEWEKKRHDRDSKDRNADLDHEKQWDSQRREHDRIDSRPIYRKDRGRGEHARTSSSFGVANQITDSIEIRPQSSHDFKREDSGSTHFGRRTEATSNQDFGSGGASDEEWGYPTEDKAKMTGTYSSGGDVMHERYPDEGSPMPDQSSGRSGYDVQSGRGRGPRGAPNSNRNSMGQASSGGSQASFGNNQGPGSLNRSVSQGGKGNRPGRGPRGRMTGRDNNQRAGIPMPMMAPTFGHLALQPGSMQPLGPAMSPAPGPPIGPGVFVPQFPGPPLVWPGARPDMNMLGIPPALAPIPPAGPLGPRFTHNMGTGPSHVMSFNQLGPGRVSPSISGPGYGAMGPMARGMPHEKAPVNWPPLRNSGPLGKAPSRGEQNDYSQNFVDTGNRPQNFIRELELTSTVEDYPKLRELIQKKDEIVSKSATPPYYYKCDLREFNLNPEFFGTKFDVILVDPPWEEYVHRAPGVADNMEYWTLEEIMNLKIEAIADTPSFIFLWVGDGVGLEQGRQCLKKWGFRRCEDICWVKTNKRKEGNKGNMLRHDSHTLFQHSKEHCLMGIKGTVRRSTDGHIIHANIDTDIIIAEEPPYGSTTKPEDMYRIIEHFSLGRRRLELFGEDHNIRSGWLTVGKGLSSSNFVAENYMKHFADKDGKVWLGGGGRNPPPEAPHLVLTTPDIESLRPKSPPQKNQQQQQQQIPTSLSTPANAFNKRATGNSPQNSTILNLEASNTNPQTPVPWASSPMPSLKGPDIGMEERTFNGYGFNPQGGGDHVEFESQWPGVNLL
ncbi:Methyltransferase-like protein 1 [Acorus gramineus]|uniref:Methyltransferase-like protein 1 n=1 Tax=Acorus gramineus TaxID=55184 RepID=A0AAV9AA68_ACOGR|nr:Methyltransferase-like protein 1 [Acorus gramineus]